MLKRRNHGAGFKVRVALQAMKGARPVPELALSELAASYGAQRCSCKGVIADPLPGRR